MAGVAAGCVNPGYGTGLVSWPLLRHITGVGPGRPINGHVRALVNVDTHQGGMSWVGTYSDGSQMPGGTFIGGPTITELVCGLFRLHPV